MTLVSLSQNTLLNLNYEGTISQHMFSMKNYTIREFLTAMTQNSGGYENQRMYWKKLYDSENLPAFTYVHQNFRIGILKLLASLEQIFWALKKVLWLSQQILDLTNFIAASVFPKVNAKEHKNYHWDTQYASTQNFDSNAVYIKIYMENQTNIYKRKRRNFVCKSITSSCSNKQHKVSISYIKHIYSPNHKCIQFTVCA